MWGYVDKALVLYKGRPLIQYSVDLALFFTRDILISANHSGLEYLGFPVVKDYFRIKAPLAGIHAGLCESKTEWNLVLTCDMPNVTSQLVHQMYTATGENTRIVLPEHNGYKEPLCGFYHRDILPLIEKHIKLEKLSLLDLPKEVPHRSITPHGLTADEMLLLFKNVNVKQDLIG
jgi:molybdopterin-guanine dinucleotide biosynthesis protein A